MKRDRAAYMRDYRATKQTEDATQIEPSRLKDERIAAQPVMTNAISEDSGPIGRGTFNSRPFTPAPKTKHRP